MENLEYKITINAPRAKVWDTMLTRETYEKWTGVAFPGSTFDGEWKQGEKIKFGSVEEGGTMVEIVELKEHEHILAKHIALLGGGIEDTESDMAKGWIGQLEEYTFKDLGDSTEVIVNMTVTPEYVEMHEESWPKMLQALKELCE